jgi:hypothetical protein
VVGDLAYIADGAEGLVIADVGTPSDPDTLGSIDMDYTCNGVDVEGDYAYVSAGTPGHGWLVVIDVSDSLNPAPEDTIQFVSTGASDVEVMGGYAYLPGRYHFYVVDVSDPTAPFIAKDLYTGIQETQNVKLFGDYAYYAYEGGMVIVDISDPPNAFVTGTYHTVDTMVGAVGVNETHAFLSHEYGLMALDVGDPSTPTWAGDFPLPERGAHSASDMVVTGNTVHATMATAGIYVIDASDPENMQIIGASDPLGEYTVPAGQGMAGGLHLTNDVAYFADGRSGLQIVAPHCHCAAGVPSGNGVPPHPGLLHNAPNPFSEWTTIAYDLPAEARVKLEVFDVTGRLVDVLVDEHRPAGPGSVAWDGTNSRGTAVPAGIYFSRLSAGGRKQSMKMLRLK